MALSYVMNTTYLCLACDARWERERRRGASLIHCPNGHAWALAREVRTCETCLNEWSRVPTKGQAPKSCPSCRTGKSRKLRVECWVCGEACIKTSARVSSGRVTCGASCKSAVIVGLGYYPSRKDYERAHPTPLTVFTGLCLHCGEPYSRELYDGTPPRYCSSLCRQRAHATRREHHKRSGSVFEEVHAAEVHARDNWTCYLCGEPTDADDWTIKVGRDGREVRCVGPLYPSLDHVEPLAHGGAHTLANLRTAHFLCNSIKRDTPLQLPA